MFGHFDSSAQTQAQMLTDMLTDIFALCTSAVYDSKSVLSPPIAANLLLELRKAKCGCLKKYGLSYLLTKVIYCNG